MQITHQMPETKGCLLLKGTYYPGIEEQSQRRRTKNVQSRHLEPQVAEAQSSAKQPCSGRHIPWSPPTRPLSDPISIRAIPPTPIFLAGSLVSWLALAIIRSVLPVLRACLMSSTPSPADRVVWWCRACLDCSATAAVSTAPVLSVRRYPRSLPSIDGWRDDNTRAETEENEACRGRSHGVSPPKRSAPCPPPFPPDPEPEGSGSSWEDPRLPVLPPRGGETLWPQEHGGGAVGPDLSDVCAWGGGCPGGEEDRKSSKHLSGALCCPGLLRR